MKICVVLIQKSIGKMKEIIKGCDCIIKYL